MKEESKKSEPIGRRIRHLRRQSGMNIRELAEKVGISRSYLSQIELESIESPTIKTIKKSSVALNMSVSELIGEEKHQSGYNISSFDFPLSEEELEEMPSEESTPSTSLIENNMDQDTLEALKIIKNTITNPEIPIQQIDNIRE